MKKVLKIVLLSVFCAMTALSAFAFSACTNKKDENKLYVGMECGYIPFNYTQTDGSNGAVKISNANGYANGYDVMIAKRIAEELGKELVIMKYEFNSLINAVQAGTLDFIIAGMSPTAERRESIDFSDAYYESNLVVVVREDGKYAEEIDIIAERPDGNPSVIARIRNESPQKKDQPLSEKDAANATLIARAPVLFHLLRMYYRLSQENEKVEKDAILSQITGEVLQDILDGKPLLFTEQVFRYRDEYLAEQQAKESETELTPEPEPEP